MVKKKKKKKPLPLTEKRLIAKIKKALDEVWQATVRKEFVEKIRVTNRDADSYRFKVRCTHCFKSFGQSESKKVLLVSGKWSKREKAAYEVDHVERKTLFKTMSDLSAYAHDLFYGPMQILCYECHKKKTLREEREKKYNV